MSLLYYAVTQQKLCARERRKGGHEAKITIEREIERGNLYQGGEIWREKRERARKAERDERGNQAHLALGKQSSARSQLRRAELSAACLPSSLITVTFRLPDIPHLA